MPPKEFPKSKNCALRYRGPPIPQCRELGAQKMTDGDFKMLTKTKAILAAALILGTASAALASESGNDSGFVMPGSMDGVNPAYHPEWFPNYANTANGGKAYGFVPAAKQTHRTSHEQTQDR
jgi:hypothetical protein